MRRSVDIELHLAVPTPPRILWALITDWERQGEWMREASDLVVTSEAREGVGVEAEATVKIGGIATRDRVRVSRWAPERLLRIDHLGWVKGWGEIRLTPMGDATTLVGWTETLRPPLGSLGLLGLLVFRPLMRRIFRRDLDVLGQLARDESS